MYKRAVLLFTLLTVLLFTACAVRNDDGGGRVTVRDRMGNEVSVPAEISRIVSTAASNTEILAGLGVGGKLVGIDSMSAGIDGVSADAVVMDMFFAVNLEEIIALAPCVVVASDINIRGGENPFDTLGLSGISVVFIPTANRVADIYDDIAFLAQLTGTAANGNAMINAMKREVDGIVSMVPAAQGRQTVYFEISPAPWLFTLGNETFINDLIYLAGGVNIFNDMQGWFEPNEEEIITRNPAVIFTNVDYMDDAVGEIRSRAAWGGIDAVMNGRVYQINADSSSRATQNSLTALRQIAAALHPEIFAVPGN
jgi:iron complex transport system substrate-binding protein